MAKLTAKTRRAIPTGKFALAGRRFPINDVSHARAALSMAHNATPAEQATIRRRVHAAFPGIGEKQAFPD